MFVVSNAIKPNNFSRTTDEDERTSSMIIYVNHLMGNK